MKDCYGDYMHKGFLIRFSEYHQLWYLEVDFLLEEYKHLEDNTNIINFIGNYESEGFKTIAEAKKYINKNELELKESIRKECQEYLYNEIQKSNYYINILAELKNHIDSNSREFKRMSELAMILHEGQEKGIPELQKDI